MDLQRYQKQIKLKDIGEKGQLKILKAKVLVVGAGGLGCPVLTYLSSMGVGTIGLIDNDRISESNLARQFLYTSSEIGEKKVDLAKRKIENNSESKVVTYFSRITSQNIDKIALDYDYLVDCTDNFTTKYLLHDYCFNKGKDLVSSSIYQYDGELKTFRFSQVKKNCLRCLYPESLKDGCVGTCNDSGILGAVAGVFGTLQAMELIKCILNLETLGAGESLHFDLLSMDTYKSKWEQQLDCPLCGEHSTKIIKKEKYEVEAGTVEEIRNYHIVDIRPEEGLSRTELGDLKVENITEFNLANCKEMKVLYVCQKGIRSDLFVKKLRDEGHLNVYSLVGGIECLAF